MRTEIDDIPSFLDVAVNCVERAATQIRMKQTRSTRVIRRFTIAEVAEIFGSDRSFLHRLLRHPDAPQGEIRGRENTLSVADIMRLRAIAASRPGSRRPTLFWRKPGQHLPVVVMSCQKGGTGKSVTAAHFAQYCNLYYGLRVGVIDADPQATCSLYFADDENFGEDDGGRETFTDFMGVPEPGRLRRINHTNARLDAFWRPTPWPGVRLIPGGSSIHEADIALYFLTREGDTEQKKVYRFLRDTIQRWQEAHPPITTTEELMGPDGRFREQAYQRALTETLDIVVIDTPPTLSLANLNTIAAGDLLIVPQTMRGFDLWTLREYLSNLNDYFGVLMAQDANPIRFNKFKPFILPTIVNRNDTDLRTIGEIWSLNHEVISNVFYRHSEGAANAFREYKSIYEFEPDRARRASVQSFLKNANAVNDAIMTRAIPSLPSRGFADEFIAETYPGMQMPAWSTNTASLISEDAA